MAGGREREEGRNEGRKGDRVGGRNEGREGDRVGGREEENTYSPVYPLETECIDTSWTSSAPISFTTLRNDVK